MQNIIIALVLTYVGGIVTGMIFSAIRDIRKQKRIERVFAPSFDPNNPINGMYNPENVIETECGPLYVLHRGCEQ